MADIRVKRRLSFQPEEVTFPCKNFYLDLQGHPKCVDIENSIVILGGKVDKFLSKEVSCVITNKKDLGGDLSERGITGPSPAGSPDEDASSQPRNGSRFAAPMLSRGRALLEKSVSSARPHTTAASTARDVLASARAWGIRIVHVTDVLHALKREQGAISRIKGVANNQKQARKQGHVIKVQKMVHPYLKVEDGSGLYRPLVQHFNSVQCVHIDEDLPRTSQSPFIRRAPPLTAVTFAPACHPPTDQSKQNSTNNNVSTATVSRHHNKENSKPKKEKVKEQNKRGFCECCDCHYNELNTHLKSEKHKVFADNRQHFHGLDQVISLLPNVDDFVASLLSTARCPKSPRINPVQINTGNDKLNHDNTAVTGAHDNVDLQDSTSHYRHKMLSPRAGHGSSEVNPPKIDSNKCISKDSLESETLTKESKNEMAQCQSINSVSDIENDCKRMDGQRHCKLQNKDGVTMKSPCSTPVIQCENKYDINGNSVSKARDVHNEMPCLDRIHIDCKIGVIDAAQINCDISPPKLERMQTSCLMVESNETSPNSLLEINKHFGSHTYGQTANSVDCCVKTLPENEMRDNESKNKFDNITKMDFESVPDQKDVHNLSTNNVDLNVIKPTHLNATLHKNDIHDVELNFGDTIENVMGNFFNKELSLEHHFTSSVDDRDIKDGIQIPESFLSDSNQHSNLLSHISTKTDDTICLISEVVNSKGDIVIPNNSTYQSNGPTDKSNTNEPNSMDESDDKEECELITIDEPSCASNQENSGTEIYDISDFRHDVSVVETPNKRSARDVTWGSNVDSFLSHAGYQHSCSTPVNNDMCLARSRHSSGSNHGDTSSSLEELADLDSSFTTEKSSDSSTSTQDESRSSSSSIQTYTPKIIPVTKASELLEKDRPLTLSIKKKISCSLHDSYSVCSVDHLASTSNNCSDSTSSNPSSSESFFKPRKTSNPTLPEQWKVAPSSGMKLRFCKVLSTQKSGKSSIYNKSEWNVHRSGDCKLILSSNKRKTRSPGEAENSHRSRKRRKLVY